MSEALEARRLLADVWALSEANQLVIFDTQADDPSLWRAVLDIDGLAAGEAMLSIDFRPTSSQLYGFSDAGRLYTINVNTGQATQVGAQALSLAGDVAKIDFDPVADQFRMTTNAEENFRLNPDTGAAIAQDALLAFVAGDDLFGVDPVVVATAHDRPFWGATQTALYGIDSHSDVLVRIGPANNPQTGQLQTVGELGIDVVRRSAFDIQQIDGESRGLAILQISGELLPGLYEIDLETGAATLLTPIQAKLIRDIAVAPPQTSGVVLLGDNRISRFDTLDLTRFYHTVELTGLGPNERVTSIDFRPDSRVLYGATDEFRVYRIDIATGATQLVSPIITAIIDGQRPTLDFNPVTGHLRVVSDAGENWRLEPGTGAVLGTDPRLSYSSAALSDPLVVAGAHSSNRPGASATVLYHIDAGQDLLVRQGMGAVGPNQGVLFEVGALGVNVADDAHAGLDIFTGDGVDLAWAVLTPQVGTSGFYAVNLATGDARRMMAIDAFAETPILGLALDPRGQG